MVKNCTYAACALLVVVAAQADWDPENGDWSKSAATDVRVMTWNVRDGVCSSNDKSEGLGNWTALARIIAAIRPDVLVIQEAGDNEGNGTGAVVDSVDDLAETIELLVNGGLDWFNDGTAVTAFVGKYAPDYILPFRFVSSEDDGFNRNAVVSRYAFIDLNGDGRSGISNILVKPDAYAPGGDAGIRGFQFAEIDLPDNVYRGDLVLGNAHLKSGFSSSDFGERLRASRNAAYFIDYWFNGAGTGVPDPNGRISVSPAATMILDDFTPVVIAGDWNEDELTNGRKGPAEWLTRAAVTEGTDGTDRDRSDSTFDTAIHVFSKSRATFGSGGKLDYIAWQDSIVTRRRAFVFDTLGTPRASLPGELGGFPLPTRASRIASDHRPVIVDLILPLWGDFDGDGDVDADDSAAFAVCLSDSNGGPAGLPCDAGDLDGDGNVSCEDWPGFVRVWTEMGIPSTPPACDPALSGACCLDGICGDRISRMACSESSGDYQGDGTDCQVAACLSLFVGACCLGDTCFADVVETACTDADGVYQGDYTDCASTHCSIPEVNVIITEITYNPDSDESSPNDVEWIEIYNAGNAAVNIGGWFLEDEDGATGVIPPGSILDAGEAAVLIPHDQSIAGFQLAWGGRFAVYPLYAWGTGGMKGLSNSPSAVNEVLTLGTADGDIEDEVNYDDGGDWPGDSPDGPSIQLLAGSLSAIANNDGRNWVRSVDGVDGAYTNTVGADFNGVDIGSPGFVFVHCRDNGDCDDLDICTFDQCRMGSCVAALQRYGDVDHNGVVNIFDILCVLRGIRGEFELCGLPDLDLFPCQPDGIIDIGDLLAVLDGIGWLNTCGCPPPR